MIKRKDGFSGERALVLPQSVVQEMEKDALSSIPVSYTHLTLPTIA